MEVSRDAERVVVDVGGVMYVAIAVASVLFGARIPASEEPLAAASVRRLGGVAFRSSVAAREHSAPGALMLVFVFLVFLILVWVLSMWRLASVWPAS